MAKKVVLKEVYRNKPALIVTWKGVSVNLLGKEHKFKTKETLKAPSKDVAIRAVNQDELDAMYATGKWGWCLEETT